VNDVAVIPACLRDRPQWVAWRYILRDGKQTKAPVNANTGGLADSTDPATWTAFPQALAACQQRRNLAGVGFVFTLDDPYCGVDLDDCIDPESGQLKAWAAEIIRQLGIEEFLGNLHQTQCIQDEDSQQWAAFFATWWDYFEDEPVTANEIAQCIISSEETPDQHSPWESLPEALLVNKDRGTGSLKRSLGQHLSRLKGRIFEGRKLQTAGLDAKRHIRRWCLTQVGEASEDSNQLEA